jgi:hypothetical protein
LPGGGQSNPTAGPEPPDAPESVPTGHNVLEKHKKINDSSMA